MWTVRPVMNLCTLYKISIVSKGTFYKHVSTLTPAWICNYTLRKGGSKLLIHSQTSTVQPVIEGWEWISNFILHIVMDVISYTYWDES